MTTSLASQYARQLFSNGYALVDGVAMHAEHGSNFQIPPDVLKRHLIPDHFVEVRIDSPRFSVHEDGEQCRCPSCDGTMSKPILSHNHPASLVPLPPQTVPSRGWGEDFWVRITERCEGWLKGIVDNPLVESRLHGIDHGDEIVLQDRHVLTIHSSHRLELVQGMTSSELKELAIWLGTTQE